VGAAGPIDPATVEQIAQDGGAARAELRPGNLQVLLADLRRTVLASPTMVPSVLMPFASLFSNPLSATRADS